MILSSIISNGMVLQRNAAIKLSGKTSSFFDVEVTFLRELYQAKSDGNGNWNILLQDLEPGGPYQMEIIAEEKTIIQDILIGDVWLIGGQSNMELPVSRTLDLLAKEIETVNHPFIRQFSVTQDYNFHAPQQELTGGKWITANASDVMHFSAAGFFFAKELYEKYGVPIGLIQTAVGGTPVEAWLSEKTIRKIGGYEALLEKSKDDSYVLTTIENDQHREANWYKHLNENDKGLQEAWYSESYDATNWLAFELPKSWENSELETIRGVVWFRKEIEVPAFMLEGEAKLVLGTIIDADDTYVNGVKIGNTGYMYPPRRYQIPKGLLKPGKNVIAVRVISTQNIGGFVTEMPYKLIANGQELDLQGTCKYRIGAVTETLEPQTFFRNFPTGLFNSMIAPLHNHSITGVLWYQGESNTDQPKGYSKLFEALVSDWRNNFNRGDLVFISTQLANFGEKNNEMATNWAELREEQRNASVITNTAMAVTIDIGEHNDLHPQDKKTLGKRLALCAEKLAYGEEIVYSGPMYKKMERIGDTIQLHFDHVGSGLVAKGGPLKYFEISGQNGKFSPANVSISGDKIIVYNDQIKEPQHVRYAWMDNPDGTNLYNKEGLPASPFTTENTDKIKS